MRPIKRRLISAASQDEETMGKTSIQKAPLGGKAKEDLKERERIILKGFFSSRAWFLTFGGMYVPVSSTKSKEALLYLWSVFTWCFLGWIVWLFLNSFPYTYGYIGALVEEAQYTIMILGVMFSIISHHLLREEVNEMLWHIGKGFYNYDGEDELPAIKKQKREIAEETKRTTNLIGALFIVALVLNLGAPVFVQMPEFPGGDFETRVPVPIKTPWDTKDYFPGFLATYAIQLTTGLLIITTVFGLDLGYVTFMIQLSGQFKLLNISIIQIEERAMGIFEKTCVISEEKSSWYSDPRFNQILNECLHRNIAHHQVLKKWNELAQKNFGNSLLIVFGDASLIISATAYLLAQPDQHLLVYFKFTVLFLAELAHIGVFCIYGEKLATESGKTFDSLYASPWYNADAKFKRTLRIIMCNTLRPVLSYSNVLVCVSSMETFNNVISTAYTYFNLVREFG